MGKDLVVPAIHTSACQCRPKEFRDNGTDMFFRCQHDQIWWYTNGGGGTRYWKRVSANTHPWQAAKASWKMRNIDGGGARMTAMYTTSTCFMTGGLFGTFGQLMMTDISQFGVGVSAGTFVAGVVGWLLSRQEHWRRRQKFHEDTRVDAMRLTYSAQHQKIAEERDTFKRLAKTAQNVYEFAATEKVRLANLHDPDNDTLSARQDVLNQVMTFYDSRDQMQIAELPEVRAGFHGPSIESHTSWTDAIMRAAEASALTPPHVLTPRGRGMATCPVCRQDYERGRLTRHIEANPSCGKRWNSI